MAFTKKRRLTDSFHHWSSTKSFAAIRGRSLAPYRITSVAMKCRSACTFKVSVSFCASFVVLRSSPVCRPRRNDRDQTEIICSHTTTHKHKQRNERLLLLFGEHVDISLCFANDLSEFLAERLKTNKRPAGVVSLPTVAMSARDEC